MPKETSGDLLGLVAAAHRLGLCVATVKAYADEGLIPVLRDSAGRRLFFASDVSELGKRRKAAKEKGTWVRPDYRR